MFFYKLNFLTNYTIRVTYDDEKTFLKSLSENTVAYGAPSEVLDLKAELKSNNTLLITWQAPLTLNAPKVCYYQIDVWKNYVAHSSYYIRKYQPELEFLINNQLLMNDKFTVKVAAVNTNKALNGSVCYSDTIDYTEQFIGTIAEIEYIPPDRSGLNNAKSIYEFQLHLFVFIFLFQCFFVSVKFKF